VAKAIVQNLEKVFEDILVKKYTCWNIGYDGVDIEQFDSQIAQRNFLKLVVKTLKEVECQKSYKGMTEGMLHRNLDSTKKSVYLNMRVWA
jgi:hypothetical protein